MAETVAELEVNLLASLRTGAWLDAQTFPPLSWVVPGLVPEGMTVMAGGPKIGKSWASLDLALATAAGGRALGSIAVGDPRPVLLLALEDGDRRLQDRCRHLLSGEPIPPLLNYMTTVEHGLAVPTIEQWLIEHGNAEPLVILDTLGKVMPAAMPGESAYQRDYRIAGRLKRICDQHPGMALLVLHHDRKAQSEDFVDGVSGTNGIAGAADTLIVVTRPRTEDRGRFKVTGRDVTEAEYEVTVSGGRWSLAGGSLAGAAAAAMTAKATENLGDRSAEILRFVAGHPDGVRAKQVGEELDMPVDDARRYMARLADAGRLEKAARGLYVPRVLSVPSVLSGEGIPSQQDTQDGQDTCSVCGYPLNAKLAAAGHTSHATCEEVA